MKGQRLGSGRSLQHTCSPGDHVNQVQGQRDRGAARASRGQHVRGFLMTIKTGQAALSTAVNLSSLDMVHGEVHTRT